MSAINHFLGRYAPWFWTAASITSFLIINRARILCRKLREERPESTVVPYINSAIKIFFPLLLMLTIIGALSIAVSFAYPESRDQSAYDLRPFLLQLFSTVTLLCLLAIPVMAGAWGYRTMRFLLTDEIPETGSTRRERDDLSEVTTPRKKASPRKPTSKNRKKT